ncbi:MAG TPA: molybdate ABC transporter permease subunit [Polyangia bacterium]|nr:molybdate ABC transporter permease subunit [Polyangia bacterium]
MTDWEPLALSFRVALVATMLATILGVAIGLLLSHKRTIGRDFIDAVTSAPLVMPPTVLGYYVLVALGRHSFVGRAWLALTGGTIVFSRTGAVVAATLGALPLVIKAARAALEGVDEKLLAAAHTLGAGRLRTFSTVHLPLASRGLIAGVMLAFARSLGDFGVTLMVAGDIPGQTQTASLAIYDLIQAHEDQAAAGMVAVLTSTAILALYAVNKLTGKRQRG